MTEQEHATMELAPVTSAPETPAPAKAAPETAAPEKAAPEKAAPETAAPLAARRVFVDLGANWGNTLRLYEDLTDARRDDHVSRVR